MKLDYNDPKNHKLIEHLQRVGQKGRRLWHLKGMLGHVHWLRYDGFLTPLEVEQIETVIYNKLKELGHDKNAIVGTSPLT